MYGGKIEAAVEPAGEPGDCGRLARRETGRQGPVGTIACRSRKPRSRWKIRAVRLKRYIDPEAGDVDLTKQDVLVAVGRGIQSRDNIALAEELAKALGGAVAGSRPVIDQGWLPLSRQVGKSGLAVKPKLYVALGISGAPEHVEGMKDSALIVAVNSDARAPIFNVAHYGIVGDVLETLPALTEAIEARKTASHHA